MNNRKIRQGIVTSNKMEKTVVVSVESRKKHEMYSKFITTSKKYKAHDETNIAKSGDTVEIMETRPLSKDKNFRLVKVVKEAIEL